MNIDITRQIKLDPSYPLAPTRVLTGSTLPIEVLGVPRYRGSALVTGVLVAATNADNVTVEIPLERFSDGSWRGVFAATNFVNYGTIANGIVVKIKHTSQGVERIEKIARGIFDVVSGSPSATPGTPGTHYQTVGGDEYLKSFVLADVQHYKKVVISYDADMGDWGYNLEGDYILADGEFVPANS